MYRLLGRIDIDGTRASVDKCASVAQIPNGTIMQIGLKAKVPPVDAWLYASPWYRFRFDANDQEVRDFLAAHSKVGDALALGDAGIEYAFFTLCPVEQSYEENFAGTFSNQTLKLLANMGLGLQVSPAAVMPDAPYWKR